MNHMLNVAEKVTLGTGFPPSISVFPPPYFHQCTMLIHPPTANAIYQQVTALLNNTCKELLDQIQPQCLPLTIPQYPSKSGETSTHPISLRSI
jgi:hypothetical protein